MSRTLAYTAAGIVALAMTGCVHTYEHIRIGADTPDVRLGRDASVYIVTPSDGRYGTILYRGSGETTARVIEAAFAKRVVRVAAASAPETPDGGVSAARRAAFSHLLVPTILHWEDRATEWSGKPDRIEVRLVLVEVLSGRIVDTTIIKGKSRWATFGGDHPQDLLPEPIESYVRSLFGEGASP
jgi:hypothetical protein